MIKKLFTVLALVASSAAMAAGPAVHLDKAPIDLTDKSHCNVVPVCSRTTA